MAATATTERCRNVRVNMDGAPFAIRAASRSIRNVPADNFDNAMFYMNDHSVRKWRAVTTEYT